MKHTEQLEIALREAFRAGLESGKHESYFDKPLDEDEYIESIFKIEEIIEDTIRVSYKNIRLSCGWYKFCDITGNNHYAVNDYGIDDSETFNIPLSQYKKLDWSI